MSTLPADPSARPERAPAPSVAAPSGYTLHFVAGLPRSGATALLSLLHQNPRLHAAPTSGLGLTFHDLRVRWSENPYHLERPRDDALDRCLAALLGSYHATDRPVVLDKQRMWAASIPELEAVLGRRVKVLAPVRPIPEILASFEALRWRQGDFVPSVDQVLGRDASVMDRARYFARADGPIGTALDALRYAVESGYGDRLLFIDYGKLTDDPIRQLRRIYDFLGEPWFEHDLEAIRGVADVDSRPHGFAGLHDVRPRFGRRSPPARELLGEAVFTRFDGPRPWEAFT
jgi:sulfotransferase